MPKNYFKNGEESVKGLLASDEETLYVSGYQTNAENRPCGGGDTVGVSLCKVSQGDYSTPLECLLE